ncbi:MAG: caspase domain-containing protein [Brasilonema octagenarum HA4186-MV1]|nr:caspase domain-containing protein [Brasilonema octagenarum HA4186-MV1]
MCPLGISSSGSSDSTTILKTGEAKLWILLVGVNEYQDQTLPSLRYPALDCQGLGEALSKATQGFPNKEVIVHHDFAAQAPTLQKIRGSLQKIVSQSKSQDTILLYFSGHGMLEPNTQQSVLCLADTHKDNLLGTGLGMQNLLQMLGTSSANQQLLCLDTCHSGDLKLLGGNRGTARDGDVPNTSLTPTTQVMMNALRQRAAQSKGFCALLSCDQGQKSWEFPELGHGVFTYYLMRGILGEAADSSGMIEADGLYKYVYRKTQQYIDKLNQQLRLINQQKLNRGERQLYPEYPQQTPKRIVEGVGELIVGFKPTKVESYKQRRAVVLDGLSNSKTTIELSRLFAGAGGFEVEYLPGQGKSLSEIRRTIQELTRWHNHSEIKPFSLSKIVNIPTCLLYLRGRIEEIEHEEAWLVLSDGTRLSRSSLRQELRRAQKTQQIIILDFIISDSSEATSVENWIEDLQCDTEYGQCLIAAATLAKQPELFSQTLLETLVAANSQAGLSIVKWIAQLQTFFQSKGINLHVWLSGTQAVIDILPGNIATIFQDLQKPKETENEKNKQEDDACVLLNKPDFKWQHNENVFSNPPSRIPSLSSPEHSQTQKSFSRSNSDVRVSATKQSQLNFLPGIDANFITKCERELAYSIGPIAKFVVKDILQSHPQISLTEFISKLAKNIPETKQALEFERRMLSQ